ncbi:glycosyl transferase [Falsochrobactrum shanghaiense]|uniref:Glycosyl transferase n=1 Tax=Falsochrobactrum shanghaiense TaxID=2201899 RepID=A0A316JB65_9HYPH|nr:glycosyltransferase [Falsochrobactrum shanghaiense]PWL16253.1 glycosyl transferase [Falsochrobactrum shanghaiense]
MEFGFLRLRSTLKISILVPCYNARGKIEACISSLRAIEFPEKDFEVIFVDDCSSDGTFDYLLEVCKDQENWSVYRLTSNSGSPSKPRNYGSRKAKGEFIIYMDCDDTIFPDTLRAYYNYAVSRNACIVRGYLIVDDGSGNLRQLNRMPNWSEGLSKAEKIRLIITTQSTTVVSFIKRSVIIDNNILWHEDIRVGEDTLFLINALEKSNNIHYIDHPTFVYNKRSSPHASSTQQYGRRELKNHIRVWVEAENALKRTGISYFEIRLHVGLNTVLHSMIFQGLGDIDRNTFQEFSDFLGLAWEKLDKKLLGTRYFSVLNAVVTSDYSGFIEACKPRLLIAGYDLKFILSSVDSLKKYFDIRIDEWESHDVHDEKRSREHLLWADYIWCEWLLANAVWYSENKRDNQKLVIRMHRMELSRNYGYYVNPKRIHAIITVSVFYFERLLQRFNHIHRGKVRLIPNYTFLGKEDNRFEVDRLFRLAAVGVVPSRKGFMRMLKILVALRMKDSRYTLDVFGYGPEHFSWVTRDKIEMKYYELCREFIEENDLRQYVNFIGQSKLPDTLSDRKVGFVLSTSDSGDLFSGPESFHLAVLDGFSGGGQSVVRHWDGCEYIYPPSMIFENEEEIVEYISKISIERFYEASRVGRKLIASRYSLDHFVNSVVSIFKE